MSKYRSRAAPGEWYHCYNRGVEKRNIFVSNADYRRFQLQLLCSNASKSFMLSNVRRSDYKTLFTDTPVDIDSALVEIGAYALMPNHFHIVLRETAEGGRAKFMQKLITGYTMYFNKRHTHTGPLLAGTYKSVHVESERYLRQVVAYVLLNPVELKLSNWKKRGDMSATSIRDVAANYEYSSGPDQIGEMNRPEGKLIGGSLFTGELSARELLRDAQLYYQEQTH